MYIKPDFSKTYYALNSNHMNMIRLMGESVFTWKINFKHFEIKALYSWHGYQRPKQNYKLQARRKR